MAATGCLCNSKAIFAPSGHATARGGQARQQEVVRKAGTDIAADLRQQEEKGALSPRSLYQKNKFAREQLSLQLLMHLNGEQMASIKASAFCRVASSPLSRTHANTSRV